MIKPLHDIVFVKRIEEETGIIVTTDKEPSGKGEVVAVGSGRILEDGSVRPLDVMVGDKIVFGKCVGVETGVEDYIAMREDDILGVLND